MTVEAGVREAGGGGGVSAASLPLVPLAPDTSTTVQQGYEFLASYNGKWRVVDHINKLPAAVGGVRQLTELFLVTCPTLALPADEQFEFVHPGGLMGGLHPKAVITGDIAAPIVKGECVLDQIGLYQVNPAGSCFQVESLVGRTVYLRLVDCAGVPGTFAGVVEDVLGAGTLDVLVVSGIDGVKFRGTLGGIRCFDGAFLSMPANTIGYHIEATANIGLGLTINDATMISGAANVALVRADGAAVFPTAPPPTSVVGVTVARSQLSGTPVLLDTSGGARDERAFDWIIGASNFRGPTSSYAADGTFLWDGVTPAQQTFSAPNLFEVIPINNEAQPPPPAATRTFALDIPLSERFTLVNNGRQDWQVQFDGPLLKRKAQVTWSAVVRSSSGTDTGISGKIQTREILPAPTPWVDVATSISSTSYRNNRDTAMGGRGRAVISPGTEFRLVTATDDNAVSALWRGYSLEVIGEPL